MGPLKVLRQSCKEDRNAATPRYEDGKLNQQESFSFVLTSLEFFFLGGGRARLLPVVPRPTPGPPSGH